MRIISGKLKGRIFNSPHGHRTHPMSDKIRGGLFNALGDIEGLTMLDAFAGTGAVGFEALSRGARQVVAIEHERNAQRTIQENVSALQLQNKYKLIQTTILNWSQTNTSTIFDLVVIDPPYDDLQAQSVQAAASHTAPDGICILSWPGSQSLPTLVGFECIKDKTYGDAQLGFYSRVS